MDVLDRLRLRKGEEVVVAALVAFAGLEFFAPKMGFGQAERLDLRPHRTVEDQDALLRGLAEALGRGLIVDESAEGGVERIIHIGSDAHLV